MNIFVVSSDPRVNARMLDDKRVNKMILETAQMLSTSHRICGGRDDVYKQTHHNHPCSIWVRSSKENYTWSYRLFIALCDEYTHRTGKTHLCDTKFRGVLSEIPPAITDEQLTPFVNCSTHKELPVFAAYKETMREKWAADKRHPKWTRRTSPAWAKDANVLERTT